VPAPPTTVGGAGTIVGGAGNVGGAGTVVGGAGTMVGGAGTITGGGTGGSAGASSGSNSGCSCTVPRGPANRSSLLIVSLAACAATLRQWRRKRGQRSARR